MFFLRLARASLLIGAIFVFSSPSANSAPSIGAKGVGERTDSIMKRDLKEKLHPTKPKRPKLMPEHEPPDRENLPTDPASLAIAATGESAAPAETLQAPQNVGTSFTGATLSDTGAFPPDSMGAVGPTQFVVFVNGRLRTFNKATGSADGVLNVDPDVFFSSVETPVSGAGVNFTSDPQVRYDRLTKRWFLVIIDVPSSSSSKIGDKSNRLLIAVSDAASQGVISGATVWTFYFVQQDTLGGIPSTGQFLDYESLGVDANALYVGGNMFGTTSPGFQGTSGFVIRKSSILSGGPIVATAFRNLSTTSVEGPYAPRGVDNFDPAANEGYFIGPSTTNYGRLILRRISNPGGSPTISDNVSLTVNSTSNPIKIDHLGDTGGTNGNLDALDDRLFAAHLRNGHLWTAHTIAVGTAGTALTSGSTRRDAVRWYELSGIRSADGTPTVVQSGTIFDSASTVATARQFSMPSVMVSGQGHAAVGFTTAGTPYHIDAATAGRFVSDAANTLQANSIYTASSTAYNPASDPGGSGGRRWGDYSFTSVDPNDDMTMWTIQEFCDSTNSYGVRVAKLLAPLPASPTSAAPAAINQGAQNADVVVTGTSSSGSGFFDPGATFPNHLAATVNGGGVTVNTVTYTDPTHATLNLNVAANATIGARTVTMTNPDGQAATSASGILTINTAVDLGVTVTGAPDPVAAGYDFVYTIVVTNHGASAASNATLTDTLSPDVTFVSATSTQGVCSGTGPVSCAIGGLASGATATITLDVKPNTGGSHPATFAISNSAAVAANEPDLNSADNTAVTATTVRADTDGDGMPDDFETAYGFNLNDSSDATADTDADGYTNVQEFLAGTDPTSAASALKITDLQTSGTHVTFNFTSVLNKIYRVERTDDLVTWTQLPGDITGTGDPIPFDDAAGSTGNDRRFYRVRVIR